MTTSQLIFSVYIYALIALYFVVLPKIFEKTGHEKWKGFVPGLNLFTWLKAIKQPWWWIFFFIPYFTTTSIGMVTEGVAFLMIIVLNVSTVRAFGRFDWKETLKAILLPHWSLIEVAFGKEQYAGETDWHDEKQVEARSGGDHVALLFSLPVVGHALVYLLTFVGQKRKASGKTLVKEWTDAILFAVVAASIIRSFVFEPFTIPTPSMEKDLLVGDYLFVSKLSYGPKLPNTPLSIPFFHNYIPVVGRNSYVEWVKRPYRRLPGVGEVDRNEVVVFNFPAGDTAIFDPGVEGLMGHTYGAYLRNIAFTEWVNNPKNALRDYRNFEDEKSSYLAKARAYLEDKYGLVSRPVDKRENYIKRCVAVAGDVLEIKSNRLIVNGEYNEGFEDMQFQYDADIRKLGLNQGVLDIWKEEYDIVSDHLSNGTDSLGNTNENYIGIPMTNEVLAQMQVRYPNVKFKKKELPKKSYHFRKQSDRYFFPAGDDQRLGRRINSYFPIFPNHPDFDWTEDNFGPLVIPAEGMTIDLNDSTFILYERCISVHEDKKLEKKEDGFYVNGEKADTYTFEMNYYWLMGDNRHRSADSRFWGFVPEDHVVGKAVFIWMSVDPAEGMFGGGIRSNRLFTAID